MITELIRIKLNSYRDRPIIVWYDTGGTLSSAVGEALFPERKLLYFAGSYLALRVLLETEDPNFDQRWLVYIPVTASEPDLLKDWELLGERLEMDFLDLMRDTAQLTVDQDLRRLFRGECAGNARALVAHWNRLITGEWPDKKTLIRSLLALTFDLPLFSLDSAVLSYIGDANVQERIIRAGLWTDWMVLLEDELGLEQLPQDPAELRERLSAVILLTELVEKSGQLADSFSSFLPVAVKRPYVTTIAENWRNNASWQDAYREQAERVEHQYQLRERINISERLLSLPTYLLIDEILLQEAVALAGEGGANLPANRDQLKQIARERSKMFWSTTGAAPWWEPITLALLLHQACEEACEKINHHDSLDGLIFAYTSPEGWWKLDYWALRLASLIGSLTFEQKERLIKPALLHYREYLDRAARKMTALAKIEGWRPGQIRFWEDFVATGDGPVVVFLIDALRYDLAGVLKDNLVKSNEFDVELYPVTGLLPSVTEVAMAALLPGAGGGMTVSAEPGKLRANLGGKDVSGKTRRLYYLKESLGRDMQLLELNEAEALQGLDKPLTVILWGDIDEFGTFSASLSPDTFCSLLERLQRLLHHLQNIGCRKFVLGTDHGFLFFPEGVEPPERIDAPAGENAFCKHRFAAGRFALTAGTWEATAATIGLEGEDNFAFPAGLTIFGIQGDTPRFLHGGLSLQEAVVPILVARPSALQKIGATLDLPDSISSATVRLSIRAVQQTVFDAPRRVKVEISAPGISATSEEIEISASTPEHPLTMIWSSGLSFEQTSPDKLTFKLTDTHTLELLEQKEVPVTALFT